MRAIRIHGFGGIDTMRLDEIPRPVPGAGEVLVAVKTAGVGPWDRLMRECRISQTLPVTLGSEVSGTVVALGAGVGVFALGDAVYGATNDQFVGGYAEYALVEAGKVAPKPAALDYVTAAGVPVVAVTAWQMLFEYARIEPGQAILVRGAAGSVGACATQMAKEAGVSVYGTARTPGHRTGSGAGCRAGRGKRWRWCTVGFPAPRCGYRHDRRRHTRKHLRGIAPERDHRFGGARARRGLCPVARHARGVFHRRRHARPARQDLGDGPTRNAKPAGRRGSRPRRREDRSPHAGWRAPQARKDCAQSRRLTAAAVIAVAGKSIVGASRPLPRAPAKVP